MRFHTVIFMTLYFCQFKMCISLIQYHLSIFAFVACLFGLISKKSLPNPMFQTFPVCFLLGFSQLCLTFKSVIHFELVCVWYKGRVQFNFFAYGYLVFPTPFVTEIVLSSLHSLATPVKNHLAVYARVRFWARYAVLLVQVSTFMSKLHCLDYCCFIIF